MESWCSISNCFDKEKLKASHLVDLFKSIGTLDCSVSALKYVSWFVVFSTKDSPLREQILTCCFVFLHLIFMRCSSEYVGKEFTD